MLLLFDGGTGAARDVRCGTTIECGFVHAHALDPVGRVSEDLLCGWWVPAEVEWDAGIAFKLDLWHLFNVCPKFCEIEISDFSDSDLDGTVPAISTLQNVL